MRTPARPAAAAALLAVVLALSPAAAHLDDYPLFDTEAEPLTFKSLESSANGTAPQGYGPLTTPNATCAPIEEALVGRFEGALQRFSQSIRYQTVSLARYKDTWHATNVTEFEGFLDFIRESYPELATNIDPMLNFELVGGGNLSFLITWDGSDPDLLPAMFSCHYDVVPTDETRAATTWKHGVYEGFIDSEADTIYGRGTADDKGHGMLLLEAATVLYKSGWQPRRTMLFLFNHEEESSGTFGANLTLHETLMPRYPDGVETLWDEGVGILKNLRTNKTTAMIAIAEKGQQFITMTVNAKGGHSSGAPTDGSAMGDILGRILSAVSAAEVPDEVPVYITQFVESALQVVTAEERAAVEGMAEGPLEKADAIINLFLGTTTAEQLASGNLGKGYQRWSRTKRVMVLLDTGTSENTLPQVAKITFNFRTLYPWTEGNDTELGIVSHFQKLLAGMNDSLLDAPGGYNVTYGPSARAYGVRAQLGASTNSSSYSLVKRVLESTLFQDGQPVAVSAGFMLGSTDSRHLARFSKQKSLRIYPYALTVADAQRIHGDNEQVSISAWRAGLCLTHNLLQAYGDLEA